MVLHIMRKRSHNIPSGHLGRGSCVISPALLLSMVGTAAEKLWPMLHIFALVAEFGQRYDNWEIQARVVFTSESILFQCKTLHH